MGAVNAVSAHEKKFWRLVGSLCLMATWSRARLQSLSTQALDFVLFFGILRILIQFCESWWRTPEFMTPLKASHWKDQLLELMERNVMIWERIRVPHTAGEIGRFKSQVLMDDYQRSRNALSQSGNIRYQSNSSKRSRQLWERSIGTWCIYELFDHAALAWRPKIIDLQSQNGYDFYDSVSD